MHIFKMAITWCMARSCSHSDRQQRLYRSIRTESIFLNPQFHMLKAPCAKPECKRNLREDCFFGAYMPFLFHMILVLHSSRAGSIIFACMQRSSCLLAVQAILDHPGFKKLTVLANNQLQFCRAQQLANIIWAFATLDFLPIDQFLESLAEEAVKKRSGFNPQNVANMLWAFAKLEHKPLCPLVSTLAQEAAVKLHEFNSQNVSNMLWAFAKFDFVPDKELLDASVTKISNTIQQYNPQVGICQIFRPSEVDFLYLALVDYRDVPLLAALQMLVCILNTLLQQHRHGMYCLDIHSAELFCLCL